MHFPYTVQTKGQSKLPGVINGTPDMLPLDLLSSKLPRILLYGVQLKYIGWQSV